MPPPIPPVCQPIADETASLEAQYQSLRSQLRTSTGVETWTLLDKLGQLRMELKRKRSELETCIQNNSAALQASIVSIDLGSPPANAQNRAAHLWDLTNPSATPVVTREIQSGLFSFTEDLPSHFGISITTTGLPEIIGPDFRSISLAAADISEPIRIEMLFGREILLEPGDVSNWLEHFVPFNHHLDVPSGGISADISVLKTETTLIPGGVVLGFSGHIDLRTILGPSGATAFTATMTIRLLPSAVPEVKNLCDLVAVSDLTIEVPPGMLGSLLQAALPLVKEMLITKANDHIRPTVQERLLELIAEAFVLTRIPSDITLSIRRLTIDATGIKFQPVLGSIGTTLSTFFTTDVLEP